MAKKKSTRKKSVSSKTKTASKRKPAAKKKAGKKVGKKAGKKVAKKAAASSTNKTPAKGSTASRRRAGKNPVPKVLASPDYIGRPSKLPRDSYPEDARPGDFQCFGPPATTDGELESVRICDMGCFSQDGKDSNKYYHGAVVQHRKSKNWYTYFEWGRTGGSSRSFQFVACQSEKDARAEFTKRLLEKNEKRGQWVTFAGIRTLRAKKGKDCYLVRPMATRSTGLPDARNIKISQRSTSTATSKETTSQTEGDPQTMKLLRDLRIATIAYTRKSMADSSIPTKGAIDQARDILNEAQLRLGDIEDDLEAQINDRTLTQLTRLMFSRIPRKKKVGAPIATWMLSSDNIQDWHDDLDAFESALHAVDIELHPDTNILQEMNLEMTWIDSASKIGKFLYQWCPQASVKEHKKIKCMDIVNVWEVNQQARHDALAKGQQRILRSKFEVNEIPRHQPKIRLDVPNQHRGEFKTSNTAILFHGTRSVNVSGILRESLRMPDTLVAVPITGAKFGPGIYFSDDWKKAADYTNAQGSTEVGRKGAVRGRNAFLFLADVVLGRSFIPKSVQGFAKPPKGHHSVFGKADHSGVDDNEFVVYKADQSRLRYLVEFKTS
jgi:hypothetical protein